MASVVGGEGEGQGSDLARRTVDVSKATAKCVLAKLEPGVRAELVRIEPELAPLWKQAAEDVPCHVGDRDRGVLTHIKDGARDDLSKGACSAQAEDRPSQGQWTPHMRCVMRCVGETVKHRPNGQAKPHLRRGAAAAGEARAGATALAVVGASHARHVPNHSLGEGGTGPRGSESNFEGHRGSQTGATTEAQRALARAGSVPRASN